MSTAVRSRVFKISAAAVTAAIAIGLCLFSQDDVSASIKERRVERLNAQIENVYTDEYQQMMDTEIADERDAKERTVDSIYTKVNPYGTNTTSMYVYFTTDQASTVSYTVSAEGYPDYTANAITSDGVMVNIDGNSNRVSCIAQGPRKVIFIVGMNKVCADLDSAMKRARNVAAPINAQRFDIKTPCKETGKCFDCKSPDTICCQFLITRYSRHTDRIHVILVNDTIGY